MAIIKNHVISNIVIKHKRKLDRFILEEDKYVRKKILSFTDVLSKSYIRKTLSVM